MIFDLETIISYAVVIAVTVLIIYAYNANKGEMVAKVYGTINTMYDTYGEPIRKTNPGLAADCESAIAAMKKAMSDEVSIADAYSLITAFLPLSKRLTKFVKTKIVGTAVTVDQTE